MPPKLSKKQGFFSSRYLCGAEVLHSRIKTPETPYRHPCRCSKLRSSDLTCHWCSCPACATARADWAKRIRSKQKAPTP